MQAYLINLARRPDRLQAMARQLGRLRIPFHHVPAVDARSTPDHVVDRRFSANGPLGEIAKGDKCCTLSHLRAYEALLASKERFGIILEDDVVLDPRASALLGNSDWIPPGVGLVKLEQYVANGRRILLGEATCVSNAHRIAPLKSKHTGAAAYVISRETAQFLLREVDRWSLPVDHMLFNPSNSPIAARLCPYQMLPTIARQSADIGGATDIEEWRIGLRRLNFRMVQREIRHAYYEVRLLPRQIASVLKRTAHIFRFEAEECFAVPDLPAPQDLAAEA